MLKTVFLSYAGRDADWVAQFREPAHFRDLLRPIRLQDYKRPGGSLAFGPLKTWLTEEVAKSSAIIAFLSQHYVASDVARAEFRAGLDLLIERKIIFAPVLLDEAALEFWQGLIADRACASVLSDYAYIDFSDGEFPQEIYPGGRKDLHVARRIAGLADLLKQNLILLDRAPNPPLRRLKRADGDGAAAPADGPGASEVPPARRHRRNLVLVGEPNHTTPEPEVAENFAHLSGALSKAGLPAYREWPHGWRRKEPQPAERVTPPATFLRVMTPLDLQDEAKAPQTLDWINSSRRVEGEVQGDVIFWSPGAGDLVSQLETAELRHESLDTLAKWLVDHFRGSAGADVPLLIIDEPQYQALENAPYSDVVRMVCDLADVKLAGYSMNAEEFRKFIATDQHRRLIVAVLDSNVSMITEEDGYGPVQRFEEIVERWQDEIAEINAEKGFPVKVVWVAVVARLAHLLPMATWNKRTLEPIPVLRVFRREDDAEGPLFAPDAASATRVAGFLKSFIAGRRP
jgi:hypothetical protein